MTKFAMSLGYGVFAILVIAAIFFYPIAVLFAWNTLFGAALTIPLTVETYLSIWIIMTAFGAVKFNGSIKRK